MCKVEDVRCVDAATGKPFSGLPFDALCKEGGTLEFTFLDRRWRPLNSQLTHPHIIAKLRGRLRAQVTQYHFYKSESEEVQDGVVEDLETILTHIREMGTALCHLLSIVPEIPHATSKCGLVLDADTASTLYAELPASTTLHEKVSSCASLAVAIVNPTGG